MPRLTLPFPPSSNNMFVNAGSRGRVKSKEYTAWTTEALWALKAQKAQPIAGEVIISIGLVAPSRRAMDASNRIKSVEDVLVKAGVIQDDNNKYVRKISAEWLASGDPCSVIIEKVQTA